MNILSFKNKEEVFAYLTKHFSKSNLILLRGSTAHGSIKEYSDFDVEVYGTTAKKPYYRLLLVNNRLTLLTIYFYSYKKGKKISLPENVKVLKGIYNDNISPDFSKDTYTPEEKTKRECQMAIDFLFKYLRSKEEKYLQSVQKRI